MEQPSCLKNMFDDQYLSTIEQRVTTDTLAARACGKKVVGVYCAFTPKELIAAAGAIPVSLCAGTEHPIALAEQHLPRNLCALIKSSYGHALGETCPYFQATDLLLADATCDGKKKMFELLARKRPLHLLQLPQTAATEESRAYWLGELCRVKQLLEEFCGKTITDEDLTEQIRLYNRLRAAVSRAFSMNTRKTPLLFGRELSKITSMGGFECNLEARIHEIDLALEQIMHRSDDPDFIQDVERRPRILLTGCPTTNPKVLDLIEESGGMVVAMENCGGLKTVGDPVNEQGPPLKALADRYLRTACACMTPNPGRFVILRQLLADYNIDGVVELTWEGCHTYNIETFQIEECISSAGLPYLHVTTDYSENDIGQLKTRIEAFLELLT